MKKCDIIIPIYNAFEYTKACIESVIKYTDLDNNRLILIDDKSPDKNILPMLEKFANGKNIILLKNDKNLGFVGTVNKGMSYSDNDVLLLNSDTQVTENWLDKIKTCAYSGNKIATVTPLSNNATLASVPKSFVPNDLPEGYTLDKMAKLVEECSFKDYPEIPTGHGFCLYITREALNDIGLFDQESYGRGYGEENDFCFRALNKGYRNLLCDDTYIYHKESASFQEDKKDLIEDGLKVLTKKYPSYKKKLDLWCQSNPLKYIANNIALAIDSKIDRPNILYIIHDFNLKNLGGTSLHAMDLINSMRDKYNFHVLSLEGNTYKMSSFFKNYECSFIFTKDENFTGLNYYNNNYKKMLEDIIENYGISLIHIHHLKGHFFDVAKVIEEKKIPSLITLHDFYSTCPLINKIYKNEKYCDTPTPEKCNECIKYAIKEDSDIVSWRKEWKYLLNTVDKVITPSENAKIETLKLMDDIKIDVIEHGINVYKTTKRKNDTKTYNVAFIGAIGIHKGSKILEGLITSKKLKNIKVHLFGIIDSQYQANNKHYINHGVYKREELKELMDKNNIDLVCLFSIWPETYSYTFQEAIACGIPVLSYNIAAISERINKYNLGYLVPFDSSVDTIIKKIKEISKDKEEYNKKLESISNYHIKTIEEMRDEYIKIYDKKVKTKNVNKEELKKYLKNKDIISTIIPYQDYRWVFTTLKWKLISKIKMPKALKKVLKKENNNETK